MELRHIRYFVAVAEELHFGRAADRLHISQPPLSHQIQNLERELGVDLLTRTKHSVRLTEAGRVFLDEARRVLGDAAHAVEVAQKAARAEIGRLSVGFGPTSEGGILKRVVTIFLSRHPNVHLDLLSLYTREQMNALSRHRIDISFPLLPVRQRGLIVEPIATERLIVALPAEHPLTAWDRVPLRCLDKQPFVMVSRSVGPSLYDVVMNTCRRAGFKPSVTHQEGQVMTVLGFVAAGLGVTIVTESAGSNRREGVVYRPLRDPSPTIDMAIAYRRGDSSRILADFRDVVHQVARNGSRRLAVPPGRKLRSLRVSTAR